MTQHRDPSGCSFSSLSRATSPRLSCVSSPLCLHSALPLPEPRVRGCKWNFVCWPFKSLSESPAVSPWQREPLLLFKAGCYLSSFRLGSFWNSSCCLREPSQSSCVFSVLPTSLIVVKWFLLSVLGYKARFLLFYVLFFFFLITYNVAYLAECFIGVWKNLCSAVIFKWNILWIRSSWIMFLPRSYTLLLFFCLLYLPVLSEGFWSLQIYQ